jgi:Na+/H+ antiporter NhaD/arsenite permease-like protein
MLVALCLALAGMSLGPDWLQSPGLTCTGFAVALLLFTLVRSRHMAKQAALHFDWRTVLLLMGIFVVVKALDLVGLTTDIAHVIERSMGGSVLGTYAFVIIVSILLSAFIDNIPYITLMLPVASKLSENLGLPSGALLAYGLLVGTCLGGNLTPLGASANVVSVELLRKRGHHVGFWDFAKMGIPFTIAATVPAAVVIWFLWR